MKLLLDTHILVAVTKKQLDRLDGRIASALAAEQAELFVSVASLWEIAVKTRLRKLNPGTTLDSLPELVETMGLALLAIVASHVIETVDPEPTTRDPFDRLLLAQCKVEGMRLVTLDRALVDHPTAYALK
jgi:PIN domain nuclease of toxin-antitoxin system